MIGYLLFPLLFLNGAAVSQPQSGPTVVFDSTFEVRLQESLPVYLVHFRFVEAKNQADEPGCFCSVVTWSSVDHVMIDSFAYFTKDFSAGELDEWLSSDTNACPHFVDVNFDGYLDLRLLSFQDMKMNLSYDYYLFNPRRGSFEISAEFTDVCNSSQINPATKEITQGAITDNYCGGCCWERKTYRVEGNHPVLSKVVTSEKVTVKGVSTQKVTTKELLSGVWKIVSVDYQDCL